MKCRRGKISKDYTSISILSLTERYPYENFYLFNIEDNDIDRNLLTLYLFRSAPMFKYEIATKLDYNNIESIGAAINGHTDIESLLSDISEPAYPMARNRIKELIELNNHAQFVGMRIACMAGDFANNKSTIILEFKPKQP